MLRTSKNIFMSMVVGLCLFTATYAATDNSGVQVKWSYIGNTGPDRWGQLNPAFALCSAGKTQSPIDIKQTKLFTPGSLQINYNRAFLDVTFNGTTQLLLKNEQTLINDGHTIQANFPKLQPNETIETDGNTYHLLQFHLHSPSENQFNHRTFPMEIHFVHQGTSGNVAVIGVFVVAGASNPDLQMLIDNWPKQIGTEVLIKGQYINPNNLLPTDRRYYSFMGSLTTPPCAEGLQWFVMPTPITASAAQIVELRKLIGQPNARSVQPLNHRPIFFNTPSSA